MSKETENPDDVARSIALNVMQRRAAGEVIHDEDVLARYANLRSHLAPQLARLKRLGEAYAQANLAPMEGVVEPAGAVSGTTHTTVVPEFGVSASAYRSEPLQEHDPIRTTVLATSREVLDVRQTAKLSGPLQSSPTIGDAESDSPAEPFHPTQRPPMAVVKLFLDGSRFSIPTPIFGDRFVIGRDEGDLRVPHDRQISARHAEIERRREGTEYSWHLVDLDSRNGSYVRVEFATLQPLDEVLLGRERYQFFLGDDGQAGFLPVSGNGRQVWHATSHVNWIGRQSEGAIATMQADPFLDLNHALLRKRSNGTWAIVNNDSRNGVWYRIREVRLSRDCSFQLGEQRFGFQSG